MATNIYRNKKQVQNSNRVMMYEDEEHQKGNDKAYINITNIPVSQYDVFIDRDIGDPQDYRDLNYLLNTAKQHDQFNFYINSPGGQLNTALMIIEGLKCTEAETIAIIQGECHSAASMIMMYCDEIIVLDSAHALIHTGTYGLIGNTSNVKAQTEFTTKRVEKLIDDTYTGFLTPDELEKVKIGVEFWFDSDEIRQRLKDRSAYLESLHKDTST
jgi:ATP-dependent protease ClpP protease subunit